MMSSKLGRNVQVERWALEHIIDSFMAYSPTITGSQMKVILYVAGYTKGVSVTDVGKALNMTNAAASRLVDYWTKVRHDKSAGPGFIEKYPNPDDGRQMVCSLTPDGRTFLENILTGEPHGKKAG